MTDAIVVVEGAVFSAESDRTHAGVVIIAVDTGGTIFARIKFLGAELNLLIAESA